MMTNSMNGIKKLFPTFNLCLLILKCIEKTIYCKINLVQNLRKEKDLYSYILKGPPSLITASFHSSFLFNFQFKKRSRKNNHQQFFWFIKHSHIHNSYLLFSFPVSHLYLYAIKTKCSILRLH